MPCNGHHRAIRCCESTLFSKTLRVVALRAIGVTGARLECCGKAAAFVRRKRAVQWPSPRDSVLREFVVQQDAACCCPAGNWVTGRVWSAAAKPQLSCCESVRCNGHHRAIRCCENTLFSKTLRIVALRAIGVTGASAHRLGCGESVR